MKNPGQHRREVRIEFKREKGLTQGRYEMNLCYFDARSGWISYLKDAK